MLSSLSIISEKVIQKEKILQTYVSLQLILRDTLPIRSAFS